MSQEVVSQKVKRECQGCGAAKEWEWVGAGEDIAREMGEWYAISREVFVEGRVQRLGVHACSLPCVPAAAIKLALPEIHDEPADDIDLDSLRAASRVN